MNDHEIQRFGEILRSSEARREPGTESQFDPAELWDLVEGKLEPKRVWELADTAIEDPELAEAWELAIEIHRARNQQQEPVHRTFHTHPWMAITAILVLAFLSPLVVRHFRSTPILRGGSTTEIRAMEGEGAVLPRDHFLLRWNDPTEDALSWDLVVMRGNLKEIFEKKGLKRPEVTVPAEALTDLKAGDRVLWQVRSHTRDGSRTLSKTFVTRLGRE